MEKEYRLSLVKLVSIVALIALILAVIFMVYPKKESKGDTSSSTYINNINMMKEAGYDYFQGDNLPDRIGESNKISLYEMVTSNLLLNVTDDKGNACNETDSYVQVTKTLDDEYTMKVFLSCDDKSDYIITSIFDEECVNCDNEETVGNSNTENNNNSSSGSTTGNTGGYNTTNPVQYVTKYNVNYVDTCKNSNCANNVYYTVNFNSNGGSSVGYQTVRSGETARYVTTSRSGYRFLGWYLDGNLYNFDTPVTRKITLTAKWEKVDYNDYEEPTINNTYSVYFNSNGGSSVGYQTVKYGETARNVTTTRTGYVFLGWYLDGNLYDFSTPVTRNITLTAKWERVGYNEYVVSFNSNGGTSVNSQIVYEGSYAYEPNDPTKDCYDFVGWYTNSSLTKKYNFNTRVTENITLYAKWENNGYCSDILYVEFDSNGGTSVRTQEVYYGERVTKPTNPTRSGYTFKGWYLDGYAFDFNDRIYEDIVLEAEWTKNSSGITVGSDYTSVYFDSNGGSSVATQYLKKGTAAFNPGAPTKAGYEFVGWYLDGEEFDFSTRIYERTYLVAEWAVEGSRRNTYCTRVEERIYSTGFAGKVDIENRNNLNYSYTLDFTRKNISNLEVVDYGNLDYTTYEYRNAYNYLVSYRKPIDMVGNDSGVDPLNYTNLMNHSFKSSNMTPSVDYLYNYGDSYYFNVNIRLFNLYNVRNATKFYTSDTYWVYFVPLYFDVEYADLTDCVQVSSKYNYKYENNDDYILVDTYYSYY